MTEELQPQSEPLDDLLFRLENTAWDGMAGSLVARFVLGNLLLELHTRGALDGLAFIAKLLEALPSTDNEPLKQVAGPMLRELRDRMLMSDSSTGRGSPSTVFH